MDCGSAHFLGGMAVMVCGIALVLAARRHERRFAFLLPVLLLPLLHCGGTTVLPPEPTVWHGLDSSVSVDPDGSTRVQAQTGVSMRGLDMVLKTVLRVGVVGELTSRMVVRVLDTTTLYCSVDCAWADTRPMECSVCLGVSGWLHWCRQGPGRMPAEEIPDDGPSGAVGGGGG